MKWPHLRDPNQLHAEHHLEPLIGFKSMRYVCRHDYDLTFFDNDRISAKIIIRRGIDDDRIGDEVESA